MHDLTRALLEHFDGHRRDLPWRRTADPYAIWVSEVMLQQTRVDAVVPYFERWMARFPTLQALAGADLDDVLRVWQGLGYYARARSLHEAARVVMERHGGLLPRDPAALRALPGIGEYTAGAVASIAFGAAVPAVDGNVRRVLARIHDLEAPGPAELRSLAGTLVPEERPGDFNQALMELGATICLPRSPRCPACPVRAWCRAAERGVQAERPRPRKGRPVPREEAETLVLVDGGGRWLLARRPVDGLLGGLFEFPEAGTDAAVDRLALAGRLVARLEPVTHTFSHKRVVYRARVIRLDAGSDPGLARGPASPDTGARFAWTVRERLTEFALPAAQKKIARLAGRALETGAGPASH